MQNRVTITERRERNLQGLEGGGGWQKTEALCIWSAQGREKGSFFCGLALAKQRCPVQAVPHIVDGESTWKYPGVFSWVRGAWGRHLVRLQLRNFSI